MLADDGTLVHHYSHTVSYATPVPILEVFSNEKIGEALELSGQQQRELRSHLWKIDKACFEADELRKNYLKDAKKTEQLMLEKLEPVIKRANDSVREVLIEIQVDELKRVLASLEKNRKGIVWFLKSDYCRSLNLNSERNLKKSVAVNLV